MSKMLLRSIALTGMIIAAGLAPCGRALAQPASGWGPGWMGPPGMMWGGGWGPGGMGPGMMWGGGWGPGYVGGCGGYGGGPQQQTDLKLTVPQVKARMGQWIAASGNPNVKLGAVEQKDADTITVDVVTAKGGTLVEEYDINSHTGYMRPAQD